MPRCSAPLLAVLAFLMTPCLVLRSQETAAKTEVAEAEPGCRSGSVVTVTDRPTISSGTETTQCGVLEVISGPERIWFGHGVQQDDIAPSLQFGLTPKLDLRYARTTYLQAGNQAEPFSGTGDTFVGARYRLSKQGRVVPSFGTLYTLKVPTASVTAGMGTGRFDHSLALLVSKDLAKLHLDLNAGPNFAGRAGAAGYDTNATLLLFGSVPIFRRLAFIAGAVGQTALGDADAYASGTLGLAWHLIPQVILDAGFDQGLTNAAPRKRATFGFSYAPVNIYALVAGRHDPVR